MVLDDRTRAGRVMKGVIRQLTDQLGDPTTAQGLLIQSAALKATRLALLSEQLLDGTPPSEGSDHHALAWLNSLRFDLMALGLERRERQILDLNGYLKQAADTAPLATDVAEAPADAPAPHEPAAALDDDQLFAAALPGSQSWAPWRAFLKALFALPLTDAELDLYRRHTERLTPPTKPFNEAALVIGRRGGKSRILALIAVYLATFRDYAPYLAAGEVATVAVIAADRKQARVIFRFIDGILSAVPMLRGMVDDQTAEVINLSNRVTIEIHTASFRVTRGYTFAAVLADETAFWRNEDSTNPDVEIFRALRPGLASIPGAMLLNASSPYRRTGVLYQAYAQHFGRDDARTLVWQAPTLAMNPTLDPDVIARAFEDDPLSAAAEYGAEFRTDIADFISRAVVEACVEPGVFERPPSRIRRYVAFIDASGGSGIDMHDDRHRAQRR